jgi:hypothetical protein
MLRVLKVTVSQNTPIAICLPDVLNPYFFAQYHIFSGFVHVILMYFHTMSIFCPKLAMYFNTCGITKHTSKNIS